MNNSDQHGQLKEQDETVEHQAEGQADGQGKEKLRRALWPGKTVGYHQNIDRPGRLC